MPKPFLEEVYKTSGTPTYTFVKPLEYQKLIVSLRTKGRGVVVEGPSGIGKTTSIIKAIEELGLSQKIVRFTARKKVDREYIEGIPDGKEHGTIIIDDFHRLNEHIKAKIADYMKTLADEEDEETKLIIVGINKAGDTLVKFAKDLNNRIDTIKFERNPTESILELVAKGEAALNIRIGSKNKIAEEANGSFHIAQMICHELCIMSGVTEKVEKLKQLDTNIEVVKEKVFEELGRAFFETAQKFATGPKLRREGRAPYLYMLYWLATSNEWSLSLKQAAIDHPERKGSIEQVVEKRFLESFLENNESLFADVLHYDPITNILSVEDPKFVYFIRNILWTKFAKQVGYTNMNFNSKYDFALSFAGCDRDIAEALFNRLVEEEFEVFYDKNEQHSILAQDVEEYLAPIYQSEAKYIVALIGPDYPKRVWTKFESRQFVARFGKGSVIPIWFSDAPIGVFDRTTNVGGLLFDRKKDLKEQIEYIVSILIRKLGEENIEPEQLTFDFSC
ncbi:TIR domain-containing protein [uncultured Paenibacillus sp.]|uniref:TIR domain-containing protein n=1 Tax=uncultured Paenibacillus sp. TaxID=227322 RepID=UPI0015AFB43C|nr:TIR domain-containing protein [uncultured Paenibacillus sp.]